MTSFLDVAIHKALPLHVPAIGFVLSLAVIRIKRRYVQSSSDMAAQEI
ncbi:hypothetical protein [Paraburkholderia fungorum]|nr:hypothetical protein [Paraburkholderia fungorum]